MDPEKRKSFYSILFVAAMDNFGFGVVFVMFAPLLLSPNCPLLPADTSVAMRNLYLAIVFAAFPLTQFLGAPFLGDLADQIGRKKALYLSIWGVILGFILSGIAVVMASIHLLIFSRLFAGFFAGNLAICLSAIADLSPSEKLRSRNFGTVTVVWSISWTVAMLVGGYLSDSSKCNFFSSATPFWITSILTVLSLVAIAKYYKETHAPKKKSSFSLAQGFHNIHLSLKVKEVRPFFFLILAWTLGWGIAVEWFATFSILEYKSSQEAISWGLLIQGLFWLLGGSLINPYLLKSFKTVPIATIGFVGATFFLALASIPLGYVLFVLMFCLAASFSSFALSNGMNLASIHAPEAIQGKIMGLSQSMMSLGWILVPLIGGYVGAKNTLLFYPLSALFMGLGALLLFVYRSKHKASSHKDSEVHPPHL